MNLHTFIASDSDETLKCFVCRNYLTYFPISICSNGQSICGRCVLPEGITSLHNEVFEIVSQFVRFPCRYASEGCAEELQPKDVPQHEQTCPIRTVRCMVRGCQWSGSLPTLTDHCRDDHSDVFMTDEEFHLDLTKSSQIQHLMEIDYRLFIFAKKFDSERKILTCAVYPNEYEADIGTYNCQFSVRSGRTTISHEFDSSSTAAITFTEVGLLFATASQDTVKGKLSLTKEGQGNGNPTLYNEEVASKLRDFLRCCFLCDLVEPSIIRLTKPLCGSHSSNVTVCKTCYQLTKVEDKILRTVFSKLTFPCRFHHHGCNYFSQLEEVKAHHSSCPYRQSMCPLCQWTGCAKDAEGHLLLEHASSIADADEEFVVSSNDTSFDCIRNGAQRRLIKFGNSFFLLCYGIKGKSLVCSVVTLGSRGQRFGYDVEVRGAEGADTVMRQRCRWATITQVFDDCCSFPKEQVFGNGPKDVVRFRVRVFRLS